MIYQLLVGRQMPIGCLGAVCFTANLWLKRQNHPESPAKSTGTNAGSRPDMSVRITRVKWITRRLEIRDDLLTWEKISGQPHPASRPLIQVLAVGQPAGLLDGHDFVYRS